MARSVYIAGNWKMHNAISPARALTRDICAKLRAAALAERVTMIIAPPFTALAAVAAEIGDAPIALAAQNISSAEAGAHTGEVSAEMLADVGVRYAIVGHSERRHYYGEDDRMVAERAAQAVKSGITPIICVGETLEQRTAGEHEAVCRRQLQAALSRVAAAHVGTVLVAYEPVWAIGTGRSAKAGDAQEMHRYLRTVLADIYDAPVAEQVGILYGGSVKPENSRELLMQPDIDGALIGGASLAAASFVAIAESVE